jgi:hypothetical protein
VQGAFDVSTKDTHRNVTIRVKFHEYENFIVHDKIAHGRAGVAVD